MVTRYSSGLTVAYSMFEASTAKVAWKPGQSLVHLCPQVKVTGVPVIGEVVPLADVAKDGNTATIVMMQ